MENANESNLIKVAYPDLEEMPDDIYANNVRVTYNIGNDFVLYFAKIDAPPIIKGEKMEKKEVRAKVVARIRLTPKIAEALSNALAQSVDASKQNENLEEGKIK